jgi:pantothenate kinase type III
MKAQQLPQATSSAILAGILFLITFSVLQVWAETLRQSPKLITLGGFLSALLFFFLLIIIGNLQRETGWLEVVLSIVVACGCALTVHRISMTICILFSGGLLLWMYAVSTRVHQQTRSTSRVAPKS